MAIHKNAAIGFDRAFESYERGRPEYPQAAIDFIVKTLNISSGTTVLDLAAGTGKFTKLLIPSAANIIAVEPVEGMRVKFQSLFPNIDLKTGTAEQLPMHNQSVDIITVAQAFHWFDGPTAIKEIHRVLKIHGRLALIWNTRDESDDWVKQLTELLNPYEGDTPRHRHGHWKKAFTETSLLTQLQYKSFPYSQTLNHKTLLDRIGSVSFVAALDEGQRQIVFEKVRHFAQTHPKTKGQPEFQLPYVTEVYWCEKK